MNALPIGIENLIYDYEKRIKTLLGRNLYGVYLYNSVAQGNFEENKSDIDVITIINTKLNDTELLELNFIHSDLNNKFEYGSKMEGMYILLEDIGKSNSLITEYPYFAQSKLFNKGYFDINNITWWSLREYGIAINSPSIKSLLMEITWDDVLDTMSYNLNEYWKGKLQNKDIFLTDEWIEFGILTTSRIIYTIELSGITSKIKAAKYMQNRFKEWEDIIQEAINLRTGIDDTVIPNIESRRNRAIEYIGFTIELGNKCLT